MAALDGDAPVKRVQLLPMGTINARDGRHWVLRDIAHANQVIERTRADLGSLDLPGDYDHQLEFGAKDGVGNRAPASGWIKPQTLTAQADGIWGEVDWTPAAATALAAKEYRYISPVFGFDKQRHITRLCNFALVNTPAIENLAAVAALQEHDQDMDFKAIAKALGLGEDATEADVLAAIDKQNKAAASRLAMTKALDLAETATDEEMIAAAAVRSSTETPDPLKFVPKAVFDELRTEVASLRAETTDERATAAVEQAMADGKVTPAQKDWALAYAKKDLKGFIGEYLATAAVVVAPGARNLGEKPDAASLTTLTTEEKATCKLAGISEEDFLKSKKELAA